MSTTPGAATATYVNDVDAIRDKAIAKQKAVRAAAAAKKRSAEAEREKRVMEQKWFTADKLYSAWVSAVETNVSCGYDSANVALGLTALKNALGWEHPTDSSFARQLAMDLRQLLETKNPSYEFNCRLHYSSDHEHFEMYVRMSPRAVPFSPLAFCQNAWRAVFS